MYTREAVNEKEGNRYSVHVEDPRPLQTSDSTLEACPAFRRSRLLSLASLDNATSTSGLVLSDQCNQQSIIISAFRVEAWNLQGLSDPYLGLLTGLMRGEVGVNTHLALDFGIAG